MGFQLVYRDNPFDTDHEFFLSHWPTAAFDDVTKGKTGGGGVDSFGAKTDQENFDEPPALLLARFASRKWSLPTEIVEYVERHLELLMPRGE